MERLILSNEVSLLCFKHEKLLVSLFNKNKNIVELYNSECLKSLDNKIELSRVLFNYYSKTSPSELEKFKLKGLEFLNRYLTAGNFTFSKTIYLSYAPLLAITDAATFKSNLYSALSRLLKRTPDAVLPNLYVLFSGLKCDPSTFLDVLTPDLMTELMGKQESNISPVAKSLVELYKKVQTKATLNSFITTISDAYNGKFNNIVPSFIQKTSILNVMIELAELSCNFSLRTIGIVNSPLANLDSVSSFLLPFATLALSKESKPELKRLVALLLSYCCSITSKPLVLANFKEKEKDKDLGIALLSIFAYNQMTKPAVVPADVSQFANSLLQTFQASGPVALSNIRLSFYFAMFLTPKKDLTKNLELLNILLPTSFKKIEEEETFALWKLFEYLIQEKIVISKSYGIALLFSLSSFNTNSKRIASLSLSYLVSKKFQLHTEVSKFLLDCFIPYLELLSLKVDRMPPPPSSHLRSNVYSILRSLDTSSISLTQSLCILLHHPYFLDLSTTSIGHINPSEMKLSQWPSNFKFNSQVPQHINVTAAADLLIQGPRADLQSSKLESFYSQSLSVFMRVKSVINFAALDWNFIFKSLTESLFSVNLETRLASMASIVTLVKLNYLKIDDVLNYLFPLLNSKASSIATLSDEDIEIYTTPKGKLVEKKVIEEEVKAVSKKKKTKEEIEEEEWQQRMAAKKLAEGPKKDANFNKLLAEQDEIRTKITKIASDIETGIDLFGRLCVVRNNEFALPTTFPSFLNLLSSSPLLIFPCQWLCIHVSTLLPVVKGKGNFSRELARCLFFSQTFNDVFFQTLSRVNLLDSLLKHFSEVLADDSTDNHTFLTSSVFSLLMPILSMTIKYAVSTKSATVTGFQDTLNILEVACLSSKMIDYPKDIILSWLLNLLEVFPTKKIFLSACLLEFAKSLYLNQVDSEQFQKALMNEETSELMLQVCLTAKTSNCSLKLTTLIAILRFSPFESLVTIYFEQSASKVLSEHVPVLFNYLSSEQKSVSQMASQALASSTIESIPLDKMLLDCVELYKKSGDVVIEANFRREEASGSKAHIRMGSARLFKSLIPLFTSKQLYTAMNFLLEFVFVEPDQDVWDAYLDAAFMIIDKFGAEHFAVIFSLLEKHLTPKSTSNQDDQDIKHEAVILLIGRIVKFSKEESKIISVMELLTKVLNIPSHSIQLAVSAIFTELISLLSESNREKLIKNTIKQLESASTYGTRKGAAFGLGGLLSGLKVSAIKKYGIMPALSAMIQDKSPEKKQAALFVFENLFVGLKSNFEPYVSIVLPLLLDCFGEQNEEVRDAAGATSRAMMTVLSVYGIRMILPVLLSALTTSVAWRMKLESLNMLGMMAFCAPKQLGNCLPSLVPVLIQFVGDPHTKVSDASREALTKIGSVIANPEIVAIVPELLKALIENNPANETKALQTLVDTSFVHQMDAAALSLILPILLRSMHGRTTLLKKLSCTIAGSIGSLVSVIDDILPYKNDMLSELKKIIVDPIPDVRAHASKALGQLYKGLGESHFESLLPWLMALLQKETTAVERSGYAQALSELIACSSTSSLDDFLPDITKYCTDSRPYVREGFLSLFVFLPKALGDKFSEYLAVSFPIVLAALADDTEPVRDVALKSGQVMVYLFSRSCTDLVCSLLEDAVWDKRWRVRDNCVRLLGDFLHRIAGQKSLINYNEEEEVPEEVSANADTKTLIENVIGSEKLDKLLSIMYICRFDSTTIVKDTAWRVWKSIVANTPKIVRDMLPKLMDLIVESLATSNADRQTAAGRSLGELVSKMGEVVLPVIVPYITKSLASPSAHARQGVAMGLGELLRSATKHHINVYLTDLYPSFRSALCDVDNDVRQAASYAFSILYQTIGKRAISEILPSMVEILFRKASSGALEQEFENGVEEDDEEDDDEDDDEDDEDSDVESGDESAEVEEELSGNTDDNVLIISGFREILSIAPESVLPILIPRLITPSVTPVTARILALLADVFGENIHSFLPDILRACIRSISANADSEDSQIILESTQDFVIAAVDERGVNTFITNILESLEACGPRAIAHEGRQAACCVKLLSFFVSNTDEDYLDSVSFILSSLIKLLSSEYEVTQDASLDAIESLVDVIPKDDLLKYISNVRTWIQAAITDPNTGLPYLEIVPAFSRPKSFGPFWPMFSHGLLYGTPEARTQSAKALGECITLTPGENLKSLSVKVTGPLIRIVGDRFPPSVKCAILKTLGLLISKSGKFLKPFLSPMQTAFVKTLYDVSITVRIAGAKALALLISLAPKVDPILNEILLSIRTKPDADLRSSLYNALGGILREISIVPAVIATSMKELALEHAMDSEDNVRVSASRCLGQIANTLSDDEFDTLMISFALEMPDVPRLRQSRGEAIAAIILTCSVRAIKFAPQLAERCRELVNDESAVCRDIATATCYQFVSKYCAKESLKKDVNDLLEGLLRLCTDEIADIRNLAVKRVSALCKFNYAFTTTKLAKIIPVAISRLADSTSPVKHAAKHLIFFAFQLNKQENKYFAAYIKNISDEDSSFLIDYCKKVLVQFRPDSSVTDEFDNMELISENNATDEIITD